MEAVFLPAPTQSHHPENEVDPRHTSGSSRASAPICAAAATSTWRIFGSSASAAATSRQARTCAAGERRAPSRGVVELIFRSARKTPCRAHLARATRPLPDTLPRRVYLQNSPRLRRGRHRLSAERRGRAAGPVTTVTGRALCARSPKRRPAARGAGKPLGGCAAEIEALGRSPMRYSDRAAT